jgi:hypothetical protein
MGRALYEKAAAPKFFYEIPDADHNDTYLTGGETYFERWRSFVAFCLGRRQTPDAFEPDRGNSRPKS